MMKKLFVFVFFLIPLIGWSQIYDRANLKSRFETGDIPTQQDFFDLIDSFHNLGDDTYPGGGGGATWGSITGILSDQTDLQAALDDKIGLASATYNISGGGNWVLNSSVFNAQFTLSKSSVGDFNITRSSSGDLILSNTNANANSEILITTANGQGLKYTSDYSAGFLSRSLIDKAFADSHYLPLSGNATMTGAQTFTLGAGAFNLSQNNSGSHDITISNALNNSGNIRLINANSSQHELRVDDQYVLISSAPFANARLRFETSGSNGAEIRFRNDSSKFLVRNLADNGYENIQFADPISNNDGVTKGYADGHYWPLSGDFSTSTAQNITLTGTSSFNVENGEEFYINQNGQPQFVVSGNNSVMAANGGYTSLSVLGMKSEGCNFSLTNNEDSVGIFFDGVTGGGSPAWGNMFWTENSHFSFTKANISTGNREFSIVRGSAPVGANDFVTKGYADTNYASAEIEHLVYQLERRTNPFLYFALGMLSCAAGFLIALNIQKFKLPKLTLSKVK